MLTLTFLGVGSAFAKRNFQSNALIEAWSGKPGEQPAPDDTLLIDFGATGPLALHQLKDTPGFGYLDRQGSVHYPAMRRIFITHLHNDHVGGLEELAIVNRYGRGAKDDNAGFRAELVGAEEVLRSLWENCLKGGLGGRQGGEAMPADYFDLHPLRPGADGELERFAMMNRYELSPFKTRHIEVHHPYDWPSYGLSIRDRTTDELVLYSSDTQFDYARMGELMHRCTTIFHEVQLEEQPDPVHTLLSELRTLPPELRRRMVLYHYSDAWDSPVYSVVEKEFAGFAQPRRRYTLFVDRA